MASPEPQLQNPLFLPLHFSILFLSLILPPFRHRPSVFIPLLILTFIPLTLHPLVSDPAASYGVATLWTFTFRAITLLLFTVPEHTLHRPSKELPGAPAAFTLRRKIGWVLSLLVSPRGVGWNVHAPFPAAVRAKSRRAYIRHAMLRALGLYLILDLSRTWNVHQPYMLAQDQRGFMLVTDPERRVWERTLDVAANAGSAWGYIEMQYLLVSAVVVGVFGGVPEEWPPLFGSLADAWCVKRLWGSEFLPRVCLWERG